MTATGGEVNPTRCGEVQTAWQDRLRHHESGERDSGLLNSSELVHIIFQIVSGDRICVNKVP